MSRARAGVAVAVAVIVLVALVPVSAEAVVLEGYFVDDNGSIFEGDIDAIAEAGITRGCNPPTNDRYCPSQTVDRGAMAAFLRRALDLPYVERDYFRDDNNSIFEQDINAIAEAGITRGCNPPTNDRYCPTQTVDRGAMAAFLRRALDLPYVVLEIPVGDDRYLTCSKDGLTCSLTVDLSAGRTYRVEEGWYQVTPATQAELAAFNASGTRFELARDGAGVGLQQIGPTATGNLTVREWRSDLAFDEGTSRLVGRWRWDGQIARTTTVIIRASD